MTDSTAAGARRTTTNSVHPRSLERNAGNLTVCDQTVWWSQTGSNRRPHACKARALPTELWPRQTTEDGRSSILRRPNLVGLGGLEPPTSRLSSARSNQLSYKPELNAYPRHARWKVFHPAKPLGFASRERGAELTRGTLRLKQARP